MFGLYEFSEVILQIEYSIITIKKKTESTIIMFCKCINISYIKNILNNNCNN